MDRREEFYSRVCRVVSEIPAGRVATYGQIAFLIGSPECSRQVGRVLSGLADGPEYHCHRVVNCRGRLVPGWSEQKALLSSEGVGFLKNGNVDLKQFLWRP